MPPIMTSLKDAKIKCCPKHSSGIAVKVIENGSPRDDDWQRQRQRQNCKIGKIFQNFRWVECRKGKNENEKGSTTTKAIKNEIFKSFFFIFFPEIFHIMTAGLKHDCRQFVYSECTSFEFYSFYIHLAFLFISSEYGMGIYYANFMPSITNI